MNGFISFFSIRLLLRMFISVGASSELSITLNIERQRDYDFFFCRLSSIVSVETEPGISLLSHLRYIITYVAQLSKPVTE
jgi:hypothetical protein